jgi:hypothetical protein
MSLSDLLFGTPPSDKGEVVKTPRGIYEEAIKACRWINENTIYRANNITTQNYSSVPLGGMFSLSNYETKESIALLYGESLIEKAIELGWKQ